MIDQFPSMSGRLKIESRDINGNLIEVFDLGKNAISYRAKAIMSRILGGGLSGALNPSLASDFNWGTAGTNPEDTLRVTGIALGNGGHLIFDSSTDQTNVLPKPAGSIYLDTAGISSNSSLPAMPETQGTPGTHGYDGNVGQQVPGTAYEKVENGNVPWDGTVVIQDNAVGVSEPNTTLYSETFRIPLDSDGPDNDGIRFISKTEVQFKATLPLGLLNSADIWGFSQQPANLISEAGLIVGYTPDDATINAAIGSQGQLYSTDGREPSGANGNFNISDISSGGWEVKDLNWNTSTSSRPGAAFDWGTKPVDSLGPDGWVAPNRNTWNMIARKNFPALTKSSSFSLVFIWTISF